MAQVTTHELGLETLDELSDIDALCLFVGEDDRPLRGTAGYVDWRLCGGLSRVIKNGFFVGAAGDWLLLPSNGRLAAPRIFVVGLGRRANLAADGLGRALSVAARTLSRARVDGVALEVPAVPGVDDTRRADLFAEHFLPEFKGRKVSLMAEKPMARQVPPFGSTSRARP